AAPSPQAAAEPPRSKESLLAYGERSPFVKSIRLSDHADHDAHTPFGVDQLHGLTPLQVSVGFMTPASLPFVPMHQGIAFPIVDPQAHRLLIHGMVDRPLEFTMDELKRFPSVTRVHYLECNGNQPRRAAKTVQESHGKTSCSVWTGVLLSTLLNEVG